MDKRKTKCETSNASWLDKTGHFDDVQGKVEFYHIRNNLSVLANADVLVLMGKNQEAMQELLDNVPTAAEWIGLKF